MVDPFGVAFAPERRPCHAMLAIGRRVAVTYTYMRSASKSKEVRFGGHSAYAALEMAILDAFCKIHNLPMWKFLGGWASQVETDLTIQIIPPEKAQALASEAASQGFNHVRIRVGGLDQEEDLARVIAVSEGAPHCNIRLAANQGFVPVSAVAFLMKLQSRGVNVDSIEQPVLCDDVDGLRYVTQHTSIPVLADESAVTTADVFQLLRLQAIDGIVVKLMKSGIIGALDIIALCKAARKELMLGCLTESGIGISTALHLACGTGAFPRVSLDSHLVLAEQPFHGGFTYKGPVLAIEAEMSGNGIAA